MSDRKITKVRLGIGEGPKMYGDFETAWIDGRRDIDVKLTMGRYQALKEEAAAAWNRRREQPDLL